MQGLHDGNGQRIRQRIGCRLGGANDRRPPHGQGAYEAKANECRFDSHARQLVRPHGARRAIELYAQLADNIVETVSRFHERGRQDCQGADQ